MPGTPLQSIVACTDERYLELHKLVIYADSLHMARSTLWTIAHCTLLGVVAAIGTKLNIGLFTTFAGLGVVLSVFWFFTAKSLSDRINWLNARLREFPNSPHAAYLTPDDKAFPWALTTLAMTWALPMSLGAIWVVIGASRYFPAP